MNSATRRASKALMRRPLVLALTLACFFGASTAGADLTVGSRAPAFSLRTLEGRTVTLASLRGKVVFLDFWASWCVPCREEFPVLQRLHQRYFDRGLRVVGITVDQEASNARAFVQRTRATFTILHDSSRSIAERYSPPSMPTSFLIDKEAVIRKINRGFEPSHADRFERQVRSALGL